MAARFGTDFTILDVARSARDLRKLEELLGSDGGSDLGTSIFQLLQPLCATVVLEANYIDMDYRAGFARFHYLRHHDTERRCKRLHFFSKRVRKKDFYTLPQEARESYLGFVVIRPLPGFCMGRSIFSQAVFDAAMQGCEAYLTCGAIYHANLAGNDLEFRGAPWMQQDTLVSACASASLWVASWYMAHRFPSEFKIFHTPQITDLATRFLMTTGRPMPSGGLTLEQMVSGLQAMGYDPVPYEHAMESARTARRIAYRYIESGIPVIVSLNFPGVGGHAVTAIGHSFDTNRKPTIEKFQRMAGVTLSVANISDWMPGLIVQDDAGGPFRHLELLDWDDAARQRLITQKDAKKLKSESPYACVALIDRGKLTQAIAYLRAFLIPLPEGVSLAGEDAEFKALNLLATWYEQVATKTPKELMVRTFLQRSNELKASLTNRDGMPTSLSQHLRCHLMSRWVWVTEVAEVGQLRHEKKVLGQVIQDSASHPNEYFFDLLAFNMPGFLGVVQPDGKMEVPSIDDYQSYGRYERLKQAVGS